MTPPIRIGARLRAARARAGLTQAELEARAGLAAGQLAHYEADRRNPSLETFRALCSALGLFGDGSGAAQVAHDLLGLNLVRPKFLKPAR